MNAFALQGSFSHCRDQSHAATVRPSDLHGPRIHRA